MERILLVENIPVLVPAWQFLIKGAVGNVEISVAGSFKKMDTFLRSANYKMLICGMELGSKMANLTMVKKRFPQMHILVMSKNNETNGTAWLNNNGMNGVLAKDASLEKIGAAIGDVYNKGIYFDVDFLFQKFISTAGGNHKENSLSPKEIIVTRLLVEARNNQDICRILGVQLSAIATYKHNIFKKLGVKSIEGMLNVEGMDVLLQIPTARVIKIATALADNKYQVSQWGVE